VAHAPIGFRAMIRQMRREARAGRALPFVVTYDGVMVGQVHVTGITWGSAWWASIGYWVSRDHAGRGITPIAVALAMDHCFTAVGLHRIEIAIRPENTASLRVVEKLGIQQVGAAPRYLHIDGAWRDHLLFAVTIEEAVGGILPRLG
jgi:ribosomal-protein-alanine N-acetyltransferase